MPNPIKYNASAETLALQKGNFWIGTGAVGKGPTSTTGYYNGITPPSGGYTLYLNKASGGPSIYCPANDAALISLTNSIAGAAYTTAQECFNYYYTQTDKMCLSQDYPVDFPYIVLDGLVLYLDAGVTLSYPGSGTTWTDVNGLGPRNNGTLINGPTYSSANGGSIVFDGTDDYVTVPYQASLGLTSQGSINIWCYPTTLNQGIYAGLLGMTTTGTGGGQSYWIHWRRANNTLAAGIQNGGTYNTIDTPLPTSISWYNFTFTWNGSFLNLYQNGAIANNPVSQIVNAQALNTAVDIGGRMFGNDGGGQGYFNGYIPIAQLYNRALSASEVLQNFNATKTRFGL